MFVHGKDAHIVIATQALTTYVTDWTLSQSVDMAETSTMGSEAKSYLSGLSDATVSFSGRYDSTAVTGPDVVLNGLVGSDTTTTFELGPEGSTTGKVKYSGTAFLTSYEISADVGDVVAFTGALQVTGALTKGTFA